MYKQQDSLNYKYKHLELETTLINQHKQHISNNKNQCLVLISKQTVIIYQFIKLYFNF